MTDEIVLQEGSAPWKPSPEAKLVETLNYYDIPLAGVIAQRGSHYLFACIEGQAADFNLWAYRLLEERELPNISKPEVAMEGIKRLDGQATTYALAARGRIVVSWQLSPSDEGRERLMGIVHQMVRSLDLEPAQEQPA